MLTKNQITELTVTDLNNLGYGVAHAGGMTVFVSGAVDGETVKAKIIKVKRTFAVAITLEILKTSPYRIPPTCTVRGCGGCAYREITYQHEKELKRACVVTALKKAGMPDAAVAEISAPTDAAGNALTEHYRNKAQYPVAQTPTGQYVIGFYGARSHRVAEAADCPLQPKIFHEIVEAVREFLIAHRIPAYQEETRSGLVRHIYLRTGHGDAGEILLTLVLNGDGMPYEQELAETLHSAFPRLVGVLINTNTQDTNVICGESYRTLWGRDYLTDTLAGVKLRLTAPSFYQVNHAAAELLYRRAAEVAELLGDEQLLDLYCGAGSIGLSMAHAVREVVGVEIVPSAVKCARENARMNGIKNARYECGDAGDVRHLLDIAGADGRLSPDVVVLDPPRKGCDPELLTYLSEMGIHRIVYISCNPDTFARDAAILTHMGYRLGEVYPFDLFPRTGHVETVCLLSKLHEAKHHVNVTVNMDK